jgi:hypothetical protein
MERLEAKRSIYNYMEQFRNVFHCFCVSSVRRMWALDSSRRVRVFDVRGVSEG